MNILDLLKIINRELLTKDGLIHLVVYVLLAILIVYIGDFALLRRIILWSILMFATIGILTDAYTLIKTQNRSTTIRFTFSLFLFFVFIGIDALYLNIQSITTSIVIGLIVALLSEFYNIRENFRK